jgi:hypothetical protein
MSETIKGFVKKIGMRAGTGRSGPYTAYSLRVELENGTEFDGWIGLGYKAPAFKEGDYGKFEVGKNDKGYWTLANFTPVKNAPKPAAAAQGGNNGFVSGEVRQSAIHYQSSRAHAIDTVELLHKLDALPLSSAKTKAGEAKRYEEVMSLVDKITVQYYYDCETHRLLKTVVDAGANVKDVGKLPDDAEDEDPAPGDDGDDE